MASRLEKWFLDQYNFIQRLTYYISVLETLDAILETNQANGVHHQQNSAQLYQAMLSVKSEARWFCEFKMNYWNRKLYEGVLWKGTISEAKVNILSVVVSKLGGRSLSSYSEFNYNHFFWEVSNMVNSLK